MTGKKKRGLLSWLGFDDEEDKKNAVVESETNESSEPKIDELSSLEPDSLEQDVQAGSEGKSESQQEGEPDTDLEPAESILQDAEPVSIESNDHEAKELESSRVQEQVKAFLLA